MKPSKSKLVTGFRVDAETYERFQKMKTVFESLGWDFVTLRRQALENLAEIVLERGEMPAIPFRFLTETDAQILAEETKRRAGAKYV